MAISNDALSETNNENEPKLVVISRFESAIDYDGKSYVDWRPDQATCLEELVVVIRWLAEDKIPNPVEVIDTLNEKNYPVSLGWLAYIASITPVAA